MTDDVDRLTQPNPPDVPRPMQRVRWDVVALAISLVVHGLVGVAGWVWGLIPQGHVHWQLPSEVEFGFSETSGGHTSAATAEPQEQEPATDPTLNGSGPGLDAGLSADAGPRDARVRESGVDGGRRRRPRDAASDSEGNFDGGDLVSDGSVGSDRGFGDGGFGDGGFGDGGFGDHGDGDEDVRWVSGVPRGSLIALRMNFDRLRSSQLQAPLRALLAHIPEWRFILDGSGVDPLRDLSKLMLVIADPRRTAELIVSGQMSSTGPTTREVAATIAQSQGQSAVFTDNEGIPTAPWHDPDPTSRTIAETSERGFFITQQGLPLTTLLAWSEARARDQGLACSGAQCLEALGAPAPDVDAELEVQGMRAYFSHNQNLIPGTLCQSPRYLRLLLHESPDNIEARVTARYADEGEAQQAATCFADLRAQYASLAGNMGLGSAVTAMQIETSEVEVVIATHFTMQEAAGIIGIVDALLPRR